MTALAEWHHEAASGSIYRSHVRELYRWWSSHVCRVLPHADQPHDVADHHDYLAELFHSTHPEVTR